MRTTDTFSVIFQNDRKNYYKLVTKYVIMSDNLYYLVNNYDKIVTNRGIFSDKRLQSGNKTTLGYNILTNINDTIIKNPPHNYIKYNNINTFIPHFNINI